MIMVSAYNPAKSPITFQKSNNKFNNTQLLKSGAPSEVQATKASRKSLGAMFRRLALPVLTALSVVACTPEDLPDVPVNPIDTTSMSETQKQTGLIINTMYGAGEESVNQGVAPRSAVDASIYEIPETLVTRYGGVEESLTITDKTNPDTIRGTQKIVSTSSGNLLRELDLKYYMKDGKLIEDIGIYKIPVTISEEGKVVKTVNAANIYVYDKISETVTNEVSKLSGHITPVTVIKKVFKK